jgi:type I restriction enzyme S subunit
MKLLPYPKYKPSGVEWLGDVPKHWEVKRLRRVLAESLRYGANESAELDDPDLPRYVRITDVHENGALRPETFRSLPKDIADPYLLKDGDLLFARSGATSGKTFLYQSSWGTCAYAGYLIRARMNQQKAVPAFVKYFTTSTSYWQWLSSIFIQSTIQNVSAEKYADLHLSLPPYDEQRSIAAFLDRETGRIDRLVVKKRELIERLKEKRTALISRTVTRGLPPAAARAAGLPGHPHLKPSGHPWLGDIPKHWEVKRIKEISVIVGRIGFRGYSTDDLVYEGEGAISMSPSNMSNGVVSLEKCTWLSWEKYYESPEIQVQPEDVVMVKTGSTIGKTAFVQSVPVPMTVNPQLMIFKEVKCAKRFLFYFLFSNVVQDVIPLHNTGSTIPTMTQEGIGKLPFPNPPQLEQSAIASYLDTETAKLDTLVAKVEEAIERLQEYRTALITAAVTGKIDVREELAS